MDEEFSQIWTKIEDKELVLEDLVDALDGNEFSLTKTKAFTNEAKRNLPLEIVCYLSCTIGEYVGELSSIPLDSDNPQVLGLIGGLLAGFSFGTYHLKTHNKDHNKNMDSIDLASAVATTESACVITGTTLEAAVSNYIAAPVLSLANAATHLVTAIVGLPIALAAMSLGTLYRNHTGPSYVVEVPNQQPRYLLNQISENAETSLLTIEKPNHLILQGDEYALDFTLKPLTRTQRKEFNPETHARLTTKSKAFRYIPRLHTTVQTILESTMDQQGINYIRIEKHH